MDKDDIMGMFDGVLGKDNEHSYHCPECAYEMEVEVVKTTLALRKIFFCTHKGCKKFGLLTVVAIKQKV